jgi:hypothetical protein
MHDQYYRGEPLDISAVSTEVREFLVRVAQRGRPIVLQENGRDLLAFVSPADLERLRSLDQLRHERFAVVEEVHRRNQDLDAEEVERDIAEEIAAMRAEDRARRAV